MKPVNMVILLAASLALTGCDQPKREKTTNPEGHLSTTQALQSAASAASDIAEEQQGNALSRFNDAKLYCLGMNLYAAKNQNLFPTNLDQTLPLLHDANLAPSGTNRFEILYHGSLDQFTNSATTIGLIVIRSDPWQERDGKWTRVYGFADGHCEAHSEADRDFDAWERQHSAVSR